MRQSLLRGLVTVVSTTSGTIALAGGPGWLHHLSHHSRHEVCGCVECAERPIVIHCCPPADSAASRFRETGRLESARQETAVAPTLIQATAPAFGYGGLAPMAVMPIPIGYPQGYPQQEAARSRQDCDNNLRRLEDDVRQLTRDVDRLVDVVDRHSRVLDRLTDYLSSQADFQKYLASPGDAALPAPVPDEELGTPATSQRLRSTPLGR